MVEFFSILLQEIIKIYKIMTNTYFLALNTFLLLCNVLFTIMLNSVLHSRRKKNEREYQTNYDYYQKLVINNLEGIIGLAKDFEMVLNDMFDNIQSLQSQNLDYRKTIEDACSRIDKIYDLYNNDVLIFVKCYSDIFYREITNRAELLYDKATVYATKANITTDSSNRILLIKKYSKNKNIFLTELFSMVKNFRPTI